MLKIHDDPEDRTLLWTYRAAPITVAARAYLYGQYRLQVWVDVEGWTLPDIIGPEF